MARATAAARARAAEMAEEAELPWRPRLSAYIIET